MTQQQTRFSVALGLATVLVASAAVAQQSTVQESPIRQPPTSTGVDGKSVSAKREKLVLADPDSKMYMRCRDPNDAKTVEEGSQKPKLNPKASVLTEEAAKQHGFKASAHEVDCPKQGEAVVP